MLTVDQVIRYINRRLGAPYVALELNNDDFKEFIQEDALSLFTEFVPDTNRITLDTSKPELIRVKKDVQNLFWIKDPDERQVMSVINVSMDNSAYLVNGYPYYMPHTSPETAMDYVLAMSNADIGIQYSKTELTWEQERNLPQVWIYCEDSLSTNFSVLYTRTHDPNLSTIPQEYVQSFKDLCLAYAQLAIGEIRTKYGTINTPINDIQVDAGIRDRGETLLGKVEEKLQKTAVIFTHAYVGP